MATTPTNKSVPSESPIDLKFNAGKIDEFVTSMARQYIDRFGQAHYTIEGLRWVAQQAISAFGYITMDSFQDGATLTLPNQVLRDTSTGEYYRWDGEFPKVVPVGSTPDTAGGVGVGAWLSVGDAALRREVFDIEGGMARTFQTVSDMKGFEIESGHLYRTSGYYAAGDGGVDCPHDRRQILSSRRGLFEGLRTDAAEVTVAPGPVVEHFNVIEDIRPG